MAAKHNARTMNLRNPVAEVQTSHTSVEISGETLTMAEMVAVARHHVQVRISEHPQHVDRTSASVEFLMRHLAEGNIVYGINTGYGGSADTRSADFLGMQRGLVQHHNTAVLLSSDKQNSRRYGRSSHLSSHCLPRSIVRGSMLARCNSLMRGHSAVRLQAIRNIVVLLNHDFIPQIPVRGSISASGDLTPLSYIAGALEGNPDIYLDCQGEILNARDALEKAQLSPLVMMPKEGLGLMNGTAVSTTAACLALHEVHGLVLASQILTGMCTEALCGSVDNFHPFIGETRPHPGQQEVARNIFLQLQGSKLVVGKDARTAGLYQDRYSLRTASQWIGPQLEDLLLAQKQVDIELNSTTDNPLVDAENECVHHGGNFQAVAITSAMEKARLALQMLGKIVFAQSSELINPMLNSTLPPNLCFDDPDVSFTFKGVDINMAAYMSELGYLANPVSSHVQSAEMNNQAINSLALVSARYTQDAVEVVSLMVATHLYIVCQALDLQVLYKEYLRLILTTAREIFMELFGPILAANKAKELWINLERCIKVGLAQSKSSDTIQRSRITAEATVQPLVDSLSTRLSNQCQSIDLIQQWTHRLSIAIESSIRAVRARFATDGPTTSNYLGTGSSIIYRYVRETLGVPLHLGLVEHPPCVQRSRDEISMGTREKKTIGSQITVIYEALRNDEMGVIFVDALS